MPTYQYKCGDCDKEFEQLVGVGRAVEPKCPSCGSAELNRKVTACQIGGRSGSSHAAGSACSSCSSSNCASCGK